jgi:hypothetical protein
MLDDSMSSLHLEIMKALVCAKDWLQYSHIASTEALSNALVKTQEAA